MFGLLHSVQYFIFLKSIGVGMLLGAIFLFLSFLRYLIPHGVAAVMAEDILFFIIGAFVSFLFLFAYNAGIPRLYVFFGESVGLLLAGTVLRSVFLSVIDLPHKNNRRRRGRS